MAISQQQRQKQLFAAEDWQVLYTAFTQVNFNAYDFPTIRAAMVEYIRLNYPEDFNDWIESSEFVAIIDLLAYLGTSIAFRMDLNTRENFLDTAQRRESIFRLARMLSYQPQRSIPATGLIKITQILSNQDIYDAGGLNLKNTPINWNDQDNPDWQEQFTLVLNASLNNTNYFGNPYKSGIVDGISTELYALNNIAIPSSVLPFQATIGGNSMNFELANPDFFTEHTGSAATLGSTGYFFERAPNPLNNWYVIYRNDGNGSSSADTGFFLFFKQGSLGYQDFLLDIPISNRIIDINVDNVNQTDVWVQNISTSGLVVQDWTQVPSVNGFNVIYNSIDKSVRNIYQVISRDNAGSDQISLRFADGNFGNVPIGLIRSWYRVSNGQQYQIRPNDFSNLKFNFSYNDNLNNTYSLVFNSSLQYTVANSQATQSNDQIALNAEQVYYTQDRMVNGEDYNLFPLQSSQALKVKAVNRTYSGQSRFVDINDPTGAYQDLNVFASDGMLYEEEDITRQEVAINVGRSIRSVVIDSVQPMLQGGLGFQSGATELQNFYYRHFPRYVPTTGLTWFEVSRSTASSTGYFAINNIPVRLGKYAKATSNERYISTGSLLKITGTNKWVSIVNIVKDGAGIGGTGKLLNGLGPVTLSGVITDPNVGHVLIGTDSDSIDDQTVSYPGAGICAAFDTTLTPDEISSISAAMSLKQTFGIGYDQLTTTWYVIDNSDLSTDSVFSLNNAQDRSSTYKDASWITKIIYNTNTWIMQTRSHRYVFESVNETRFYWANKDDVIDQITGKALYDYINVLGLNYQPEHAVVSGPIGKDNIFKIYNQEIYPDGYSEPASVRVTLQRTQNIDVPDDPDQFLYIVDPAYDPNNKLLFWERVTSSDGYQFYTPVNISSTRIYATRSALPSATAGNWTPGELAYVVTGKMFFQYQKTGLIDVTADYKVRVGRKSLNYLWKHYATYDQRINPAVMNIIDVYVLTSTYNDSLRNWISVNGNNYTVPLPPSTESLSGLFSYFEQFKMMTDQIVWHPVTYKILFGSQADPELQAIFKVVKVPGSSYSDNEVKSLVKEQIDAYFSLKNWDFGQSFFFTELSTYIQMNLATIVASIVMVPTNGQAKFGDLFEIIADPDEIFISSATVNNIVIVGSLTEAQLGITNG